MPDRATILAATPKCPCSIADGGESRSCAEPMWWDDVRRVWVCSTHPHMEVFPDELTTPRLAPSSIRERRLREARQRAA